MAVDDDLLLGARNGFLVVIVVLFLIGIYEIYTTGSASVRIGGTWVAGVAAFYLSKWYHGRDG